MPESVIGTFQGNAQAFQSSLSSEPALIAAALVVVYIILGMLYESFVHAASTDVANGWGHRPCADDRFALLTLLPQIGRVNMPKIADDTSANLQGAQNPVHPAPARGLMRWMAERRSKACARVAPRFNRNDLNLDGRPQSAPLDKLLGHLPKVQIAKDHLPRRWRGLSFFRRLRCDGLRGRGAQPWWKRTEGGKSDVSARSRIECNGPANIIFIGGLLALNVVGLVVAWVRSWRPWIKAAHIGSNS
jgi:AcrB/AcrD/AcrF family